MALRLNEVAEGALEGKMSTKEEEEEEEEMKLEDDEEEEEEELTEQEPDFTKNKLLTKGYVCILLKKKTYSILFMKQ